MRRILLKNKNIFELPLDEFEKQFEKMLSDIPIEEFIKILNKNGIEVIDIDKEG